MKGEGHDHQGEDAKTQNKGSRTPQQKTEGKVREHKGEVQGRG